MEANDNDRVSRKGLGANTLGLSGAVAIGVSSVAPAYTLTGVLGPAAAAVGTQIPAVFLLGFLPMLMVALGYRELSRAMPDSGTSFTWISQAFGPRVGWMGGWGLIIATILVLSNLAAIGVGFFYLLLSELTGQVALARLDQNPWIDIATFLVFTTAAAWFSCRDLRTVQLLQGLLVLFQLTALLVFAACALWKVHRGTAPAALPPAASWMNPFQIASSHALAAGLSLSIFIYWGWDVVLSLAEETQGSTITPGRAATLTMLTIGGVYLLLAVAALSYAGLGESGLGLGNPAIQDNLFRALARPVLGSLAPWMASAVLISSLGSLQSTFAAPARTLQAMAHYGALPDWLGKLHPRFRTPVSATLVVALASATFYVVTRIFSDAALRDTIAALGMLICFYYGLTSFAAVWYFRSCWFESPRRCLFRLVCPLLGGLLLTMLFIATAIESINPHYGSGAQFAGIGLVFWLGIGMLCLGALLMGWRSRRAPTYFRSRRLAREGATDENGSC